MAYYIFVFYLGSIVGEPKTIIHFNYCFTHFVELIIYFRVISVFIMLLVDYLTKIFVEK